MKVSILLISYNQQEYINECVESILRQEVTFDVEIIAADDQSTDATPEIIAGLLKQSKFQHKILVDKQNLGISKNYQRGFAACCGEYIAVMEGDDYWDDPMRLAKHIAFLDENPKCVLSFNRLKRLYHEKNILKIQEWNHPKDVELITTSMMALKNRIGNLSACVFRKSALQKLKPEIYELGVADWMLGMAVGEHGTLAKFKEPMSVYRVHEKGKWSGKSKKENFSRLINSTIPKYDKFLGYKYHDEFEAHKKNLEMSLERDSSLKHKIIKMIPSGAKRSLSYILPEIIKAPIRNLF